ncbi:MAG TPA: tetratricopeptide repeat protein [Tepidisphaeraceae bacterium]|jgi:predicted O-linked N-acetylglucosamine transferase (SPINDLY family)
MADRTIEQLVEEGFQLHQSGDFAGAERAYQNVLARDPNHSNSLHLLGVLAFQVGQMAPARELIERAIAITPDAPQYHGHLGLLLASTGNIPGAIAAYRQALRLKPDLSDVLNNLANALKQSGAITEAVEAYRRAITILPDFAEAHNNLGLLLHETGHREEAVGAFRRAIASRTDYADAWNNLGNTLMAGGLLAESIVCFEKAIALRPQYAEAFNNLGNALKQSNRAEEAIAAFGQALNLRADFPEPLNNMGLVLYSKGEWGKAIEYYRQALSIHEDFADARYNLSIALRSIGDLNQATAECRRAIALRPSFAPALNNLGILLHEQGDLSDAQAAFEKALAAAPDYPEAHNNLANVLRQAGQYKLAVGHYRRAVMLRPDYAAAHNNLGTALQQSGRPGEAMASYQRALELQPTLAEAHNNIGNLFKDQAELDEAIESYERATALSPNDPAPDSNRVYTMHFHPGYTAAEILQEHLLWNQRHAVPLRHLVKPHDSDPIPQRRLRIGYVSPDFRDHCQAMFTIPLLSNHDHKSFEIYCYADVPKPDAFTARLQGYADTWRSIVGCTDQQVADLIRRDRIDILIDLSVHMSHNRLLVFARKPAPIQVTWLGYPGTTGLETIDYRLSDPYLDPMGARGEPTAHDNHYSEQTLRLPDTFWCYNPLATEPAPNALPALKNGFITFGCLNNFCKVTGRTIGLWGQIMSAVPNSRLLVLVPRGVAREHLLEKLAEIGVQPTRVEFVDRQPRDRYLALHHRIDLGLDTFPYNGHTTTLDALWMGVPVTTIIGRTAVSRGGWSQLSNLGLRELAAKSDKQFVRNTVELAGDLDRLARLRATLRDRLTQSPLMDAPEFAANVEAAYRAMWLEWTTGQSRNLARTA